MENTFKIFRITFIKLLQYSISGAILLFAKNIYAQDLHFSQFYEAPLIRNPALAGLFDGDVNVQLVYRNQWARLPRLTKRVL